MALLDSLFQQPGGYAPVPGFDALDAAGTAIPPDGAEGAELARIAAAKRLAGAVKRKELPFPDQAPVAPLVGPVAGILSGMGINGAGQGSTSKFADDIPPGAPVSTNDPLSGEPKTAAQMAEVPLPRSRPEGMDYADQNGGGAGGEPAPLSMAPGADRNLPPNATPTEGRTARGAAAAPEGGGIADIGKGLFNKIFDPNKAATWLALGAGFAGAPTLGQGISRASAAAIPAMTADRKQIQTQQTISDTYRALVAKGVPSAEALAASQNPEIMKAVAGKYFEAKTRVPHQIGTDMMGNPIMGSFDPNTGKYFNVAGHEITGGSNGAGGAGGIDPGAGMLAKGVTEINDALPAEEYKAQFSPTVQAQIESYVNGDTMPTGNPRLKGSAEKIKQWAQTWGSKAGVTVSDAEFSGKRTMRNDINKSTPNTIGGILSNGKSAFGHLANLSDKFVDLGSLNGPNIPFGGAAASIANRVGSIAGTADTKAKIAAVNDNALKYGQESTKFYAGTGGGEGERMHALKENNPETTTGKEQAAFLQTEKELMLERLNQKEAQIRNSLGDRYLKEHPVRDRSMQEAIDKIDRNIAKLRGDNPNAGGGGADARAPITGKTALGIQWSVR